LHAAAATRPRGRPPHTHFFQAASLTLTDPCLTPLFPFPPPSPLPSRQLHNMMRATIAVVCLALFAANMADAQTLSCNVGASMDADGKVSACTTSDKRYKDNKPFEGPSGTTCIGSQFACLTGNWAGDFETAYGCFGGGSPLGANQIANAKTKIIAGCQSSPTCLKANPNGVPTGGWTSCNTTNCNTCSAGDVNSGGVSALSAPSLLVGLFALLLTFVSQV